MALKAIKPKLVKPKRPKTIIFGREKVGKSLFAAGFPNTYYIDTEAGATRDQYQKALEASGGMYFGQEQGALDFKTVLNEIKNSQLLNTITKPW